MEEEKTFDKLRRNSISDMLKLLSEIKRPPAMFNFGTNIYEREDFYPEITFHLERVALLKEYGWSYEDFYLELERKAVLDIVFEYNSSISFPQPIIDRAKRVFPDVKFTPAKIELE